MLKIMIIATGMVLIAMLLLTIGIMLKGKFPNLHVSGNKAMRQRGIGCVQSQDREARKANPHAVEERVHRKM